jgi:hypothetical protein
VVTRQQGGNRIKIEVQHINKTQSAQEPACLMVSLMVTV